MIFLLIDTLIILYLFVKTESKDALDMLTLVTVTEFTKYNKIDIK